jgi:D-alanine-D-alanine ligase
VLLAERGEEIVDAMALRKQNLGGACFAEKYIEGREFNVSLLAGDALPPAEILFDAYPAGKIRVVGYRAKWEEESFEYAATRRSFSFSQADKPLLERLVQLSLQCWRVFGLRGYARVDFRVDDAGAPWILEVNANPCLSPDAGFLAAAAQARLSFPDVLRRIIDDAL